MKAILLFFPLMAYSQIFRPYLEKDSMIFYKVPTAALKPYCEYSPQADFGGWHGGIETTSTPQQTWLFRRPTDEDRCKEFMRVMTSIKSKHHTITIMGYIPHATLVYFGAVKGEKECFEWFSGDCKKF